MFSWSESLVSWRRIQYRRRSRKLASAEVIDTEESTENEETGYHPNNVKDDLEEQKGLPLLEYSGPPYCSSLPSILWSWRCALQTGVFLACLFTIWEISHLPQTNLHESSLTDDGKSFPSGQLTWSQKFTPLPCGKSPTEALARGCHFDIIATAWLPPRCIDYDLIDEFTSSYPWQYFRHANGTDPYSEDPDTLGLQTGQIWTTSRWHTAHCLFMWKKLNRALVKGRLTDGETVQQGHTDHCSNAILRAKDLNALGAIVEIIYPPC